MVVGQPTTIDEYNALVLENQSITGYGFETTMHLPCPFCAAKDFMVYRIIDAEEAMIKGAVCSECKRGAAVEFTVNGPGKQFEFVQTCGDDIPTYLPPIRRKATS
jgi:hypothetical protein